MPGKVSPSSGPQGFHALIDGLRVRIFNLESWQRQTRGIPAGTITRWGGTPAPAGALLCDGSAFDPALYPALYAALGSSTLPSISTSPITIIWT